MKKTDYSDVFKKRVDETEKIIESFLPSEEGEARIIFEAMNYSVLAGGKRLRPLIMWESYKAFGGSGREIEPFMAAMECIHTYSLVHDDLPCMDNDEFRRGKKTTWSAYGYDIGVLCGDALLNYAFETAVKAFPLTDDVNKCARAMKVLADKSGCYGMLGGQVVDVINTDKAVNADQLDLIFRLKTGALIQSSMMIGAIMAGASDEMVRVVEEIGLKVGVAFQIRDDILDCTSTTEVLGKPVGSDEKNNKTTYVSLYGLDKAQADVLSLMEDSERLLRQIPGDTEFLGYIFDLLINRSK
ncbi:MAG: polyprenyl synthetase family protein [Lachnospiraceae bacterium]|nr:polyprenyl synthetase family protein [Lachnospiraceae bacterium]